MELLSPAGNLLAAYAAFKGGADAVYIGGQKFSARASADNFSKQDIQDITFFAHSIGKRIYVTLNTLLFEDEFFEAVDFAKFLYAINVDGVIIQDLGLAHYLHQVLPNLPLNASTQLNCHNIEQAKALIKLGFKRIVLARETNLEFAKQVKDLGVEVEVFGHGALCVSYSGNCLLSSFIGDRSGNRGRCAQPCRMTYDLLENGKKIDTSFTISTKDLMTLDYLEDFINVGVDSLKIEGRLKSNEYIYAVSSAYRHAIDSIVNNIKDNNQRKTDKENLIKIFNRQFTKGYVLDASPFEVINSLTSSHQGVKIGTVIKAINKRISIKLNAQLNRLDGIRFSTKDQFGLSVEKMFKNGEPVESGKANEIIEITGIENAQKYLNSEVLKTKDYLLVKQIENELKNQIKVDVQIKYYAHLNEPTKLTLIFNNEIVEVEGEKPLEASGLGTTKERIIEQLSKTGNFPYRANQIYVDMEKCFIPISLINNMRNNAFEKLVTKFTKINEIYQKQYFFTPKKTCIYKKYTGFTNDFAVFDEFLENGLDSYNFEDKDFKIENRITQKCTFFAQKEAISFPIIKQKDNYLIATEYCNITNSYAIEAYISLGFDECVLSLEVNHDSAKEIMDNFRARNGYIPMVGFVVYGRPQMMIMKSCPIGTKYNNKKTHCNLCHKNEYLLVDRMNESYQLLGDSECNIRVFNNKPIYLLDKIDELEKIGINSFCFSMTNETKKEASELIKNLYSNTSSYNKSKHTRGHYFKRPL